MTALCCPTKEMQTLISQGNIGTDMMNNMLHAQIFTNLVRCNEKCDTAALFGSP